MVPVDIETLAPVCLEEACVFASCLHAGVSSKVLKDNLQTWWKDVGKDMFFGSGWDEDLEEEFSDEEDMEELSIEQGKVPDKELEVFEHCLEVCEKNVLIEEELSQLQKDPSYMGELVNEPMDEEPEKSEDVNEPEHHTSIRALKDVLDAAGLSEFVPQDGDSENKLLLRARKLMPHMRELTVCVRMNEGILSKSSIVGPSSRSNPHNLLEAELASARRVFQCTAERQSRHQTWRSFSEKVVDEIQENVADDSKGAVRAIPTLAPPVETGEDGIRSFQVLVVRPFSTGSAESQGGLKLALCIAVWRCGKSLKTSGRHEKLVASGRAPIQMITKVHVQLLMPISLATSEDPMTHLMATFFGFDLGRFG